MTAIHEALTQRTPRYDVVGRLGRGGFATVERAYDRVRGSDVALKTLLPHLADDGEVRRRFLTEARLLAGLRHPNLVAAYDIGQLDGLPFFTMELIEGRTLAQSLPPGLSVPLDEAARIMAGVCAAVDTLHGCGLVHRDITSSNVMLEGAGRVVLMDLGIARSLAETTTGKSELLGTPECIAPEQVAGLPAGPAADIYALGVLSYRLLCGRPPFSGETSHVLHAHVYESPPSLRMIRPGLPERVYQAIEAALAKDPTQRPARAADLAAALHQPQATLTSTQRAAERPAARHVPQTRPRIQPRRTRRGVGQSLALAATGLAVIGGIAWYGLSANPGPRAGGSASISNLRVFDNVFTANEGAFVPGESVAACLDVQPGERRDPLTLIITDADSMPGTAMGSRILGRSQPALPQDAPACIPVALLSADLRPGDYRVWVLQGATPLASARFTALRPF